MSRRRKTRDEQGDGPSWADTDEGADLEDTLARRVRESFGGKLPGLADGELASARLLREDPRLRARLVMAYAAAAPEDELEDHVEEALEIDDGCLDALRVEASFGARSQDDLVARLVATLRHAESRLPPGALETHAGRLEDLDEGCAYLRVRMSLAAALRVVDRRERAIQHAAACAALSPLWFERYAELLAAWYLQEGRTAEARATLATIRSSTRDALLTVRWCDALADVLDGLAEGERAAAVFAVVTEGGVNSWARFLDPDSELSEAMSGETLHEDDELDGFTAAVRAWRTNLRAVTWLRRQLAAAEGRPS